MSSAFGTPGTEICPCGSGNPFAECCGQYLTDGQPAPTAEALMRSRYTAYVRGDADYMFRTWHPKFRPAQIDLEPTQWTGLRIMRTSAGLEGDSEGVVEFVATWRDGAGEHAMHEVSSFERRAGRWFYTTGEVDSAG